MGNTHSIMLHGVAKIQTENPEKKVDISGKTYYVTSLEISLENGEKFQFTLFSNTEKQGTVGSISNV